MDATHALFQAVRVPGDVIVDHVPAELQVDALASRLGRHQDLAVFPELALRSDAGARGIPIADLHAPVDLGDVQAPCTQFPERSASLAVAGQIVQGILVLSEEQEFHLRIAEDASFRDDGLELGQFGLDFPCFQRPGLVH